MWRFTARKRESTRSNAGAGLLASLERGGPRQVVARTVLTGDGRRPCRLTVDPEDEPERGQRLVEVQMDGSIRLDSAGLRQCPILAEINEDDVAEIANGRTRLDRNDRAAFVLRIVASLFWAAFGIVAHTPAAIIANIAAILLCVRGLSVPRGKGSPSA